MKYKKNILMLFFASSLILTSCVDAKIEEVLEYENHYQTTADVDNAILGVYGSFMRLAEQMVVLNELRGDLMDVTTSASMDLQEINLKKPGSDNKYSDPTQFFSVIQNCNDILANVDLMYKSNKLTKDQYNERYSDVTALRTYVYLQLGIQFGKVPYITDPIVSIEDVQKYSESDMIGLDELIDKLIACMEGLPTLDDYVNSPLVEYTLDGYELNKFFINKHLMLADLYLWKGKYLEAATEYRKVLATDEEKSATANYITYKCRGYVWKEGETPNTFQVYYIRYMWDDLNSYRNSWYSMFQLPAENNISKSEWIWTMSYDKSFAPTYPFISLFSNEGKGKYQLMPSTYAVDSLWENQVQKNGFKFDGRGRNSSFKEVAPGQYVVQKYLYNYDSSKPFEQQGRLFLYRAGLLHLRYAEAANRAGYPKLAYALVNQGVNGTFYWSGVGNDSIYQSGYGPGKPYPAPFYLDGRISDNPSFRSPWRENAGIRGRASLKSVEFPSTCTTTNDSIQFMEKVILQECALETGFEGNRWGDLVRIAHRMNKEGRDGNTFLNDNLKKKYQMAGEALPDYSSEDKWFLPFRFNK
jgi:hypothetical protein